MQIVFNPEFSGEALAIADKARNEYVLAVKGKVVERDAETYNPKLPTGEIEVRVTEIEILNPAKTPPFSIEDGIEIDEAMRLKYRYLDLRRPEMQKTLLLALEGGESIPRLSGRARFHRDRDADFDEKHAGRRARLSRAEPRASGRVFRAAAIAANFQATAHGRGLERYYQIARCFRDEDLRADRQPEFTQVDIETSFMSQDQLLDLMERLIVKLFKETIGVEIASSVPTVDLCRCDEQIRLGQAGSALRPGNGRSVPTSLRIAASKCSRPSLRAAASGEGAECERLRELEPQGDR